MRGRERGMFSLCKPRAYPVHSAITHRKPPSLGSCPAKLFIVPRYLVEKTPLGNTNMTTDELIEMLTDMITIPMVDEK